MALGGALGLAWSPVTPRHFAWQAWHKLTSTVVLRGRRSTHGTGWRAWTGSRHFAWQAWHFAWQAWDLVTSTLISRGRRGTNSHPPSFCVAGVALMALGGALGLAWSPVTPVTPRHFAWQAWRPWRRGTLRGRRGTNSHPPSFCMAGVALMALGGALGLAWSPVTPVTPRHFAWQAWRKLTSTVVLRGRRGTYGTGWRAWSGFVAWAPRHFAWQAWHLVTSTLISRGRRGTNSHPPSLCVAGVALMVLRGALGPALSPGRRATLRGRRGTWWHPPWYHVAGVARTHIYRRFAWQAWHLWYWVARLVRLCRLGAAPLCVAGVALCVAGVALGDIHLDITWQAWHELTSTVVLRGRRGTYGTGWRAWSGFVAWAPRHFAWQAWHLVTSTLISRGRRGTNSHLPSLCTNSHLPSLCVAGVALGDIHLDITWQAWHELTSTVALHGRRGTPHLCVGFLFLILYPGLLLLLPPPPPPPYTYNNNFTHTNLTYINFTQTYTHTQT